MRFAVVIAVLLVVSPAHADRQKRLERACRRGDDAACVKAARRLLARKQPAEERARKLLERACRREHQPACAKLRELCLAECRHRNQYTHCADDDGNLMDCPCRC